MPSLKLTPRRLALIAVIVFIAVAIALTLYWQRPPQQDYVTAPARPGDIENAVLATGRLDAVERVNVGARVSGEVKSLKVKLGDRVTKGQPIADIDDLQQRNDLRNAEAALNVIKAELQAKQAQLKQAESRFKRQRRMLNDEASSREDFETAEATLATTRAELLSLNARWCRRRLKSTRKRSTRVYPRRRADGRYRHRRGHAAGANGQLHPKCADHRQAGAAGYDDHQGADL